MEKEALGNIKKKVSAFILEEEGRISKEVVIALGAFIGTAAIGAMIAGVVKGVPVDVSSQQSGTTVNIQGVHSVPGGGGGGDDGGGGDGDGGDGGSDGCA